MRRNLPRPAHVIVLALLAGGLLPGCDAIQKARDLGRDIATPDKFGAATRDVLETGPEGTKVRLMVESTAPASWLDAKMAIEKTVPQYCIDGESHFYHSETPEGMLGGMEAVEREHPAGTTFTAVVQCLPPPPYEFALEPGTTEEDASKTVSALLQGEAAPDHDRFTVAVVSHNDRSLKYPSIARAIGWNLGRRLADCPAGISVNRLVVAAHPRPEPQDRVFLNRSYAVLGIDAVCQELPAPKPD